MRSNFPWMSLLRWPRRTLAFCFCHVTFRAFCVHEMRNFTFRISQITNRISQIAFRISHFANRISQIAFRKSQIAFHKSHFAFRKSHFTFRISQIAFHKLQIAFRFSQIAFPISLFAFRISQIAFHKPDFPFRKSHSFRKSHFVFRLLQIANRAFPFLFCFTFCAAHLAPSKYIWDAGVWLYVGLFLSHVRRAIGYS